MLASVTIDFATAPATGSVPVAFEDKRRQFWESFSRFQMLMDPSRVGPLTDEGVAALERQFRTRFPRNLERLINAGSSLPREEPSEAPDVPSAARPESDRPRVTVRLLAVEYGSVTAVLEVLSNETVQNVILTALEMYSPFAFQEALQTNIGVIAQVDNLGGGPPGPPTAPGNTEGAWARIKGMLRTAWVATSLLVPVLLSLAVLAGAVWAVQHELDALHEEAGRQKVERTEILKALVDQNKSFSSALVEYTKGSATSAKAMDDLTASLIRRLADRAFASGDSAGLTTSVDKLKADVSKLSTDMDKLSTRVGTLEGRPPPASPVPSNCQPGSASADCAQIQMALFRKVGKPADPRHPQQAWTDGVGGPATLEAIHLYLTSIRAPQADYLSPSQIKELLTSAN